METRCGHQCRPEIRHQSSPRVAFAFGRDGAMDARNYFNCASNPCAFGQSPALRIIERWSNLGAASAARSSKISFSSSAPTRANATTSGILLVE